MKFLVLTQFFPPEMGAPQTRLSEFCQGLINEGHEVEVITAMPNYPTGRIFESYRGFFYKKDDYKGINLHRFWLYAAQGKSWKRLLSYLSFTATSIFGLRVCKKPDYIFVNSGPLFLAISARVLSLYWNVPVIFNVADLWPRSVEQLSGTGGNLLKRPALWLESWSYNSAKFVTAVTEGIRSVLLSEKNLPANKVLFLPNGVNTQLYAPKAESRPALELKKKLNLSGKFVLIYSGNHGHAHALSNVVEAAHYLQSEAINPMVHFLLIGDGSEKNNLVQRASELKLRNLTFHDPVSQEELVHYLQLADVGLINVRNTHLANETRPAKMFPMMSMAKPILYAGFGEGAEIIKLCEGGLVVDPENPKALAMAAHNMSQKIHNLTTMGTNCRSYVEKNLQFSNLIKSWLRELETRQNSLT